MNLYHSSCLERLSLVVQSSLVCSFWSYETLSFICCALIPPLTQVVSASSVTDSGRCRPDLFPMIYTISSFLHRITMSTRQPPIFIGPQTVDPTRFSTSFAFFCSASPAYSDIDSIPVSNVLIGSLVLFAWGVLGQF